MQRRQHESTGAFNAVGALPRTTVDVVVISADEALLTTLQQSAGPEHVFWHAPSAESAVELLVGGHCGILIADLHVVRDPVAVLSRLQAQFPELVLLATGRREEEGAVAGLVSKGAVYRFLHKPVSPARANVFLATAARRYHELSQTTSPAIATVKHLTQPANRVPLIAGGAVAVLLAVATALYLMRTGEPATPVSATAAPEAAATASASPPAGAVTDVLAAAQAAFEAGRLSRPPGNNALELFRSVLAIEAGNPAAQAGEQEVLDALEMQVTAALNERNAPAAVRALTVLQEAAPEHPQLPALREQLLAVSRSARPEPAAPRRTDQPTVAARATPATDLARARLADGLLVEPAADSALFHLRAARDANEDESANRILATDLGTRLLAQARSSIESGEIEAARRAYADAVMVDGEFELALPDLVAVAGQLDDLAAAAEAANENAMAAQLAGAVRLRESGQLIAPAGNNAFESLQKIAAQYPNAADVRTELQRLAFTLLDNARTSIAARDLDQAELLVNRAGALVPRMSNTRTLREQIAAARAEQEAASRIMQAREIPRTREVAAIYPAEAQRRGTEGWVDVEFTIAPDGSTNSFVIKETEPAGVFDKAAVDALRKWRFEPVVRNGVPVAQRAVLRVRFTLD